MPKINIIGHDYIPAVCDVARMYFEIVRLDGHSVTAGEDGIAVSSVIEDGIVRTRWEQDGRLHEIQSAGAAGNAKREVKRQIYQAFSSITGITFPWGSLTGIRPTLVALECRNDPSKLEDVYFVSKEKAALAIETGRMEERIQSKLPPDLYHCYIGIPFCSGRCLYCSFVSGEYTQLERWIPDYVDVLIKELSIFLPLVHDRLQSLYIGGGTPTSLPDDLFEKLLRAVSAFIHGKALMEYTVEAGRADSITDRKLSIMKKYGVNRLCINPQTMRDKTLCRIGRGHTAEQVTEAFRLAQAYSFDAVNMDLIAGLPGEDFSDFKYSLDELIRLSPENITVHTLSLKRASDMTKIIRGDEPDARNVVPMRDFHIPNREISDMIEYSVAELAKNGYHPYYLYRQKNTAGGHENVGYAKEGRECLYNVAMMGDKNSILALGAGAMSKKAVFGENGIRTERLPNVKDVRTYLREIDGLIEKKRGFFGL